jgi:hypothetical protein
MFIPFLAAAAVSTTFVQLGTMSVEVGTRTLVLKAVSIVFMATLLSGRLLLSTAGLEHADRKVVQPLPVLQSFGLLGV